MERRDRATEETARVGVVGAGPAACLLAAALLDGARARRRRVEVTLFDGGARLGRTVTPLVVNAQAMARLAAMGFPLPAAACAPVGEVQAVLAGAMASAPFAGYAAARGDGSDADMPAYLRAGAVARGARLVPRAVEDVTRAFDGTWALRASGRTERFDVMVLACGAGAPLAATVPGHRPPPLLRGCAAVAPVPDALRVHLGGRMIRVFGRGGDPDLWLVPRGDRLHVLGVGEDVDASSLAEAVIAAVCAGGLPALGPLGEPRRVLLAAGAARPGVPATGDALGGVPGELGLARVALQAQRLAGAYLDGGEHRLLAACEEEAAVIRGAASSRASLRRLWLRRARPASRALQREERTPGRRPVTQALATQADPSATARSARQVSRGIAVLWALVVAAFLILRDRVLSRRVLPHRVAGTEVFVVEDDPDQSAALCAYLEGRGFSTRAFGDGMGCAAAAARERPAAIVIDVALPWMDGPAVCRALRRAPETSGLPVVLVTALPPALAASEAARCGADAVMSKPLDLERLVGRLSAWTPPRVRARPGFPRPARAGTRAADPRRPGDRRASPPHSG